MSIASTQSSETQSQADTKQSATAAGDEDEPQKTRRIAPPRPTNPTATWYAVAGPNGDLTWRVESPAHVIEAKVQYIPDDMAGDLIPFPTEDETFRWSAKFTQTDGTPLYVRSEEEWKKAARRGIRYTAVEAEYPDHEGSVAVWTRPLAHLAAHMLQMKQAGLRVVSECDDNYLSSQAHNVFLRKADFSQDDRDNHARSICSADAVIFSTEYLRDLYYKGLRDLKKILPPFHVCRNHIDGRYVPTEMAPSGGRLRIGYMGSDSHLWDIDLIYPALREAYEAGHEIVFVGIHPHYSPIRPRAYDHRIKARWSDIEFTHIPWRNEGYRNFALPLDIAFAPLVVNNHTLGKSDIKWMEYALSGAATIAQNCVVYNRTAKHGETALLASSPAEYLTQMRELIKNERLRLDLVENTRQYIKEERMIEDHVDEWREAVFG